MTDTEKSFAGWTAEPSDELPLARIIDLAFDYRGNTTVVKADGTEIDGYVFNRNAEASVPFIQMFGADGAGPFKILYTDIRTIKFTGKDTAAGNSYAAWLKRREKERGETAASSASRTPDRATPR